MTDYQSEQYQNLRDILGFDPNDHQPASDNSETRSVSHNPSRLELAARAAGVSVDEMRRQFLENIWAKKTYYNDPDNLFTISELYEGGTIRKYFQHNPNDESSPFKTGIVTKVNSSGLYLLWIIQYHGEQKDREHILRLENRSINLYKMISLDRIVNVYFDEGGRMVDVRFSQAGGDTTCVIRLDENGDMKKYTSDSKVANKKTLRHFEPPDFEFGIDVNGMYNIVMRRDGQETDRFHVPGQIDIERLTSEMMPEELLRNPKSHDLSLDYGARAMPPFERIGASWEVLEERPDPSQ